MPEIAVLIPCYNEEKTIGKVIKDFKKELPKSKIYVYDNNSTDNTIEIAKQAGAIVRYEHNQGKGNVIQTMFKEIDADVYIIVDGDDTYPADEINKLLQPVIDNNVDMAIGDRLSNGSYKKENKKIFHNIGNNIIKDIINLKYNANLKDILTGYRVLNKKIVKELSLESKGFEIETELTIKSLKNKYRILEIPITYRDRPEGSYSKIRTFKDGMKILKTINKIEKNGKRFFKYIYAYALLIFLFLISMIIISSFPSSIIKENTKRSADIILEEGNNMMQYILLRNKELKFDNYTDALMINNAYSIDDIKPLESAMLVRKNYIPGITKIIKEDTKEQLKSASKYKLYDPAMELYDTVNENVDESFEYARYWHGYLTIIRPMLIVFNITQIRIIFSIILFALAFLLLYLLAKKIDIITSLIFLIGLICIEYFYIGLSIQGSFGFFITMIASIYVLIKGLKIKNIGLFFFIVGSLVNFFDFLTTPIISFSMPLIIYFLIKQKEKEISIKETFYILISLGVKWCLGYILTWGAKWILVDLLFDRNLIQTAIGQVMYRSSGENTKLFEGVLQNLAYEKSIIFILLYIKMIKIIIMKFFIKTDIKKKYKIEETLPYILIATIPFIWYIVVREHSNNHPFFTYRSLIITIIGILISIKKDKILKIDSKIKD